MHSNYFSPYQMPYMPTSNPNAVNINIIAPQAYGSNNGVTYPMANNGFYSLYGQNMNPTMPMYPQNYNNLALQQNNYPNQFVAAQYPQASQQPETLKTHQGYIPNDAMDESVNSKNNLSSQTDLINNTKMVEKTSNEEKIAEEKPAEEPKTKKVVPLTDDYIKSLENYMNNENPKIRLIGAKEILERFKEDENRIDNPSLMPLLNKALRDTSPSVRFLALTVLQLGYAAGNDETVAILKEIQAQNTDKIGEDALLASEILLNMAQGQKVDVPMTQNEIDKMNKEKQGDKQ